MFIRSVKAADERIISMASSSVDAEETTSDVDEEYLPPVPERRTKSALKRRKPSPKVAKEEHRNKKVEADKFRFAIPQFIVSDDATELCDSENSRNIKTLTTTTIVPKSLEECGEFYSVVLEGVHSEESIYKCKHCPKAFSTAEHLILHSRKVHMCQHCLECFAKTSDLSKHIKEVHHTFGCLICDRSFRSNGNLRQHMRNNHSVYLPAQVTLMAADRPTYGS